MQRHDFTIGPANPRAQLYAAGFYIRYRASSFESGNDIRIQGDGFDVVLTPGQAMRLPIKQSLWSITAGPDNTGALLANMSGEVIIGDGSVDDDSTGSTLFQLTATGNSVVDTGLVTTAQLNFALGGWITNSFPKRFFKSASFSHDGASAAWVDIFMTTAAGGAGFVTSEMALNTTGYNDASTAFRSAFSPPAQRVFLDRAYMPPKGRDRIEWFFPPTGNLYFRPTVQGADTLNQINMALTSYQL